MRSEYIVIKELKAPIKLTSRLYLFDIFFLLAYIGLAYSMKSMVHETLQAAYLIFSAIMALILTSHLPNNPQKRFYHMIYYWLLRDRYVYHAVSDEREGEQENI